MKKPLSVKPVSKRTKVILQIIIGIITMGVAVNLLSSVVQKELETFSNFNYIVLITVATGAL